MNPSKITAAVLGALALLGLASGQAVAADRSFWVADTQDLFELCTMPRDDPQRDEAIHYCLAYLDGVVDYHDAMSAHEEMKPLICYPETATLEQGVLFFIRWVEEQNGAEELMAEAPVIGVVRALADAWPCES